MIQRDAAAAVELPGDSSNAHGEHADVAVPFAHFRTLLLAHGAQIGGTPLREIAIRFGDRYRRVWLKLEGTNAAGSIKDRTAIGLLDELRQRGNLVPDRVLVESTSGNVGVALALVAGVLGIRFIAVVDPKTSPERVARLAALGAQVELVGEPDDFGGYLLSRLRRVKQICSSSSDYIWTNQYGNPGNPRSHYMWTGPEMLQQMDGTIDAVYIAVSTGGTLGGVSHFFREASPRTRVVAVDAAGSIALGGDPAPRLLNGIGSSQHSEFVTADLYDELIRVRDREAFAFCRALHANTGIKVGGSSGALLAACAHDLAVRPDLRRVLVLCPDGGANYESSIFSDRWCREHGMILTDDDLRPATGIAAPTP